MTTAVLLQTAHAVPRHAQLQLQLHATLPPVDTLLKPIAARAQATPDTTCLVVNHENITWNYYRGRDRAFLLAGALFRVGGAAALLSNRRVLAPARACTMHVFEPLIRLLARRRSCPAASLHTKPRLDCLGRCLFLARSIIVPCASGVRAGAAREGCATRRAPSIRCSIGFL